MLMTLFIVFILVSAMDGNRELRRAFYTFVKVLFGFWAFGWILRCGFGLLPLIIIVTLITQVVFPFLKGFVESFSRK